MWQVLLTWVCTSLQSTCFPALNYYAVCISLTLSCVGWSRASNLNQLRKLYDKQVKAPDLRQLYTSRFFLGILSIGFWILVLSLAGLDKMCMRQFKDKLDCGSAESNVETF